MHAGTAAVHDALLYLAACAVDERCSIHLPSSDNPSDEASESDGRMMGLKSGLAAAFFGLTVFASYLPTAFMRSSHYQVCCVCTSRGRQHA